MDHNVPSSSPETQSSPRDETIQHVIMYPNPAMPRLFARRKRGRPVMDKTNRLCENCGVKNTPEWRMGPTGPHTLCNACGIHYLKDSKRQKKDTNINNASVAHSFTSNDGVNSGNTSDSTQFMIDLPLPNQDIDQIPPPCLMTPNIQLYNSNVLNQYLVNIVRSEQLLPFTAFPTNFVRNIYENSTSNFAGDIEITNNSKENITSATPDHLAPTSTTNYVQINNTPPQIYATATPVQITYPLLQRMVSQYNWHYFQPPLDYPHINQISTRLPQALQDPTNEGNANRALPDSLWTFQDAAKQPNTKPGVAAAAAANNNNQAFSRVGHDFRSTL